MGPKSITGILIITEERSKVRHTEMIVRMKAEDGAVWPQTLGVIRNWRKQGMDAPPELLRECSPADTLILAQ